MSKLDVAGVHKPLTELAQSHLEKLEVFSSIASTNTYLMSQAAPAAGRYRVAIADHQTSGRGRHYRRWISAPGSGVYLSFAYTFPNQVKQLGGLTLAIGVGAITALQRLDVEGLGLKWPNDIVALDGKLGGILTEVQSGRSPDTTVVTGIGLNVAIDKQVEFGGDSNWAHQAVDLESIKPELPGRELIAGNLIDALYLTFRQFGDSGLSAFMNDWRQYDWLRGREVTVDMPERQITGIAAGIGDDGTLLVDVNGQQVQVLSGSIVMAGPRESKS